MNFDISSAMKDFRQITECPICLKLFTDPKVLPCIHTFCTSCLEQYAQQTQKKSGEKMSCPLCRKEFIIPAEGVIGLQKNFFMENMIELTRLWPKSSTPVVCDLCKALKDDKPELETSEAAVRCLECQDNFCETCAKIHTLQKATRNHHIVEIGKESEEELRRLLPARNCDVHPAKPLDYYCTDCKKIVCVSCFVETHSAHQCKDVNTVEKKFREAIGNKVMKILNSADEVSSRKGNTEKTREGFLRKIAYIERAISERHQELKSVIDQHFQYMMDELNRIKEAHLKEIVNDLDEIERSCVAVNSFEAYCTELRSKGSASDICGFFDELCRRAEELERDQEALLDRPYSLIEVSFEISDFENLMDASNNNIVGRIRDNTLQFSECTVVVGINDGDATVSKDVIRINIHRPCEVSDLPCIPDTMEKEAAAATYNNTLYLTGLGINNADIWKYSLASGWSKCGSIACGRRRHSVAFVEEVLYICGGFVDAEGIVLDSVEAFNVVTNECTTSGKLIESVQASSNGLAVGRSIYIFGGKDKDNCAVIHGQVYNTEQNTCTLLSEPMPTACHLMRAALWDNYIILIGGCTCFLFNLETQTWHEREQFKTDVVQFGLILQNGRIFVIGGGVGGKNEDGKVVWNCRDDIRCTPVASFIGNKSAEWEIRGRLPKPSLIQAYAKLIFSVEQ